MSLLTAVPVYFFGFVLLSDDTARLLPQTLVHREQITRQCPDSCGVINHYCWRLPLRQRQINTTA